MKKATPAEQRKALESLCPVEEGPALTVLDRSTIERWAGCPWAAQAIESGRVNEWRYVMASGAEGHDALSRATLTWILSGGALSPSELANELETELRGARPDVQPDVLNAARYVIWPWAKFLSKIHPLNIIGCDGGETLDPPRSGQLSLDIEGVGVRVTSELDLLYSGPSIDLLHEVDYKTGHKQWTAGDVAASFQFQLHAVLVFANFPAVQALEVTIWNTRSNDQSYRVIFERRKEPEYRARLRMALQPWWEFHGAGDGAPTWPAVEKCAMCSAAALCPVAGQDVKDAVADPLAVLAQLVAVEAKAKAIDKILAAQVDATGVDLELPDGTKFGRAYPASERKRPTKVY